MIKHLTPRAVSIAPAALLVLTGLLAAPRAHAVEEIELPGLESGSLQSSELQQGTHILVFFASWSPRCRTIVQQAEELEKRFGKQAEVALVNFQEDAAAVRKFMRQHATQLPVYLDRSGAFSKQHAVTNLPHLVVIQNGKTRYEGRFPREAATVVGKAIE